MILTMSNMLGMLGPKNNNNKGQEIGSTSLQNDDDESELMAPKGDDFSCRLDNENKLCSH